MDLATLRGDMVDRQLASRGIRDRRVLEAMRRVPRERFVAAGLGEFAYDDAPLPIAEGQTISQPYIVALMAEAAAVGADDRVLDVGTGSGYGAAVLSRVGAEVFTIERHPSLLAEAEDRFAALGYDNIHARPGDGSQGWPEAAPFDAIVVGAAGPVVPEALKRQLAIGGRLVIPVGEAHDQRLLKVVRHDEQRFDSEDLGAVAFVPLVGRQGWEEGGRAPPGQWHVRRARSDVDLVREAAETLPAPEAPSFAGAFDRFAEKARVVLLGEATHGTSEFYRARAAITRRLIERHGFTIVAVEADWPDAAAIDRHVRHRPAGQPVERAFARFPTWMWRNAEVARFVEWLRSWNKGKDEASAGFYGLDLYSLHSSMRSVLEYLDKVDPAAARIARERYGCLTPWRKDPAAYGRAALREGRPPCEADVLAMLEDLLKKRLDYAAADGYRFFDATQNARLVANAEKYYRVMYLGDVESWNLRDTHMFETLEHLLASQGEQAKAVVWAHNSHIGDASATEMGWRGELNLGQLCRERFGGAARLIGFGTDRGTVAAASDWGGEMEVKRVRPAMDGSYERLCRDARLDRFLLDLREGVHDELRVALDEARLERAIGVIYRPETERLSHYFETSLPRQLDAWVWFAETEAVQPLSDAPPRGAPDTWPFAV
jgi:protein-L-isoaspartate(D-aspartate) O-methyltransferase